MSALLHSLIPGIKVPESSTNRGNPHNLTEYPEKLWSLYLWRHSKPNWTKR